MFRWNTLTRYSTLACVWDIRGFVVLEYIKILVFSQAPVDVCMYVCMYVCMCLYVFHMFVCLLYCVCIAYVCLFVCLFFILFCKFHSFFVNFIFIPFRDTGAVC